MDQTLTSIAEKDPWYQAFMKGAKKHDLEIVPRIFPAGTDSRYIREVGIPAFGFSPMNNTPGKVISVLFAIILKGKFYFLIFSIGDQTKTFRSQSYQYRNNF